MLIFLRIKVFLRFMKIFKLLIFISYFYTQSNVITFFVNEYGFHLKPQNELFFGITKKIVKKNTHKNHIPIFATYAGYLTTTNEIGQIVFPRETIDKSFEVLITNQIEPVFMFPYTISHWKIKNGADAHMYKINRVKENGEHYWNVKNGSIPSDKKINDLTIIIFAKPKNVIYSDEKFKANPGGQMLLPPVYVKSSYQPAPNALFTINIINLFKKVFYQSKENKDAYSFDLKK